MPDNTKKPYDVSITSDQLQGVGDWPMWSLDLKTVRPLTADEFKKVNGTQLCDKLVTNADSNSTDQP